jgi:hypothetical protein
MKKLVAFVLVTTAGCATAPSTPRRDFFDDLSTLCGKTYEGRIVSPIVPADAAFAGKRLVMHVRECSADTIRIPIHVGDDRSRTWVFSRTGAGIRLKHDHRHQDGGEDKVTQYGGDSDRDMDPVMVRRTERLNAREVFDCWDGYPTPQSRPKRLIDPEEVAVAVDEHHGFAEGNRLLLQERPDISKAAHCRSTTARCWMCFSRCSS